MVRELRKMSFSFRPVFLSLSILLYVRMYVCVRACVWFSRTQPKWILYLHLEPRTPVSCSEVKTFFRGSPAGFSYTRSMYQLRWINIRLNYIKYVPRLCLCELFHDRTYLHICVRDSNANSSSKFFGFDKKILFSIFCIMYYCT